MAISAASGSQTATLGVEHTLATIGVAGVYALLVDAALLVNGETLTLRIKTRARAADTTRLESTAIYKHVQGEPIPQSIPVASMHEIVATLQQDGGTGRAFPWNLIQIDG